MQARWPALLSRLCAGVLGGYAAAAVFAVWLSYVLPMPRADAVATGVLISFALYAGVIVYAFAAHSLRRLWFGVLGFTGFFALAALALRPAGAGW